MQPQAQAHTHLPLAYIHAEFLQLFEEAHIKQEQARNTALSAMQNTLNTLHGMDNLLREHYNVPRETGGTVRGILINHPVAWCRPQWCGWFRDELAAIYDEVRSSCNSQSTMDCCLNCLCATAES